MLNSRWTLALFLSFLAPAQQLSERPRMLSLTLKQAVDLALAPEGNVRVQIADELTRQSRARSAQARAALLPNVEFSAGQQNQIRNLEALGLRIESPFPGVQIPERVGPFNTFDARATASQSVFDLSAIRRFQASRAGIKAAQQEAESRRDQTAAEVAKLYLAGQRAEVSLETAKANVELAEALRRLALDRKRAGTGTGIEVTRAEVQLANERQDLLVAENQRRRAHLELLKAMGLKLETKVELIDRLVYQPFEPPTLEQAVVTALETRPDLKAQQQREQTARLTHSATRLERIPSVAGFADYGTIGTSVHNAFPTRTYGLSVRVPVFDGGRRDSRRSESLSQLRQEQLRTSDLREQAELEIRLPLDSLRSAEQQVKVAEEGLGLAEGELAQARRRYEAGVTTSLEVTDAQTRLHRARQNLISALVNHNIARLDLGQAMGIIRGMIQ